MQAKNSMGSDAASVLVILRLTQIAITERECVSSICKVAGVGPFSSGIISHQTERCKGVFSFFFVFVLSTVWHHLA